MGRIAVMLACAFAAACSSAMIGQPRPRSEWDDARRVHESSDVAVDGCEYVGDFVGTGSDRPGGSQRWGLKAAAAKAGATDVVYYSNARSYLVATGYRCSSSAYGGQDAGDADVAE